jgi:hypothetical protein
VAVDWRIRSRGDALKVIDVAVEGVSMSVTQKSEFSAVIQRGGGDIEALLQSLRQRVGEAGWAGSWNVGLTSGSIPTSRRPTTPLGWLALLATLRDPFLVVCPNRVSWIRFRKGKIQKKAPAANSAGSIQAVLSDGLDLWQNKGS